MDHKSYYDLTSSFHITTKREGRNLFGRFISIDTHSNGRKENCSEIKTIEGLLNLIQRKDLH